MKQVHWQLPFASLNGTQYRIDIYSDENENENENWPIQLVGGVTPFVTDEDNSDDRMKHYSGSTGTINIVNDGGLFEELLPLNDTDRPVLLVRESDNKVVWHGFLSCEEYSQGYVDYDHEITLNVNSVLEALKSVSFDRMAGYRSVREIIVDVLRLVQSYGVDIESVVYPKTSQAWLNEYINVAVFYEEKEIANEEKVSYEVVGKSCKSVLTTICSYIDWRVVESGRKILFITNDDNKDYYEESWSVFQSDDWTTHQRYRVARTMETIDMSKDIEWTGNDHEFSSRCGAKSVEVSANIKTQNGSLLDIMVPEMAYDKVDGYIGKYYWAMAYMSQNYNSKYLFKNYGLVIHDEQGAQLNIEQRGSVEDVWNNSCLKQGDVVYPARVYPGQTGYFQNGVERFVGALPIKYAIKEDEYKHAIYLVGYPLSKENENSFATQAQIDAWWMQYAENENTYAFKMETAAPYCFFDGYLVIDGNALQVISTHNLYSGVFGKNITVAEELPMKMAIRFGRRYWHVADKSVGETEGHWGLDFATVNILYDDNTGNIISNSKDYPDSGIEEGYVIPINMYMVGQLSIMLFFRNDDYNAQSGDQKTVVHCHDWVIRDLSLRYVEKKDDNYLAQRSSNNYFKLLSTGDGNNFSEEISIDVDIASWLFNRRSISVITDFVPDGDSLHAMEDLEYMRSDGTTYKRRPESVMLDNMARYYGSVRRRITLNADRPTECLPMTKVMGYDGRMYVPMAESRDWKMERSRIVLMEE